jgi:transposase-like protein
MTEERMALLEFVRKGAEPDFLRELLQFTVQRLIECEIEGRCGAARHERTEDRTNSRNGYRERQWQTRVGALELKIPKLRLGTYYPAQFSPLMSLTTTLDGQLSSVGSTRPTPLPERDGANARTCCGPSWRR